MNIYAIYVTKRDKIRNRQIIWQLFVDYDMKIDLNKFIGILILFILTVFIMKNFKEQNEYRFEVFHLLLLILGIALARGRIIEFIQHMGKIVKKMNVTYLNDEKE